MLQILNSKWEDTVWIIQHSILKAVSLSKRFSSWEDIIGRFSAQKEAGMHMMVESASRIQSLVLYASEEG